MQGSESYETKTFSGSQGQSENKHNQQNNHGSQTSQQSNKPDHEVESQICGKKRHTALKCYNRFNHVFQGVDVPQTFAVMTLSESIGSWHLLLVNLLGFAHSFEKLEYYFLIHQFCIVIISVRMLHLGISTLVS